MFGSSSISDVMIKNYEAFRNNSVDFFDEVLSGGVDLIGSRIIRIDLRNKSANMMVTPQSSPTPSGTVHTAPAKVSQQSIYIKNPESLDRATRDAMNGPRYQAAKDFCLHTVKIGLFNLFTALMITKVALLILGCSSVTLPLLAGLAVQAIVRDILDKSVEKSNLRVNSIISILSDINIKLFKGDDWLGGNKKLGFFRTFTPFPHVRAAFMWH